jgi:Fur family zinc uptake transcriptional regulator
MMMTVAEDLLRTMSEQGMRITEQRKSLVALFIENKGYLSAKDVYNHLERQYPGVSFDTIYRNLRLMNEMELLEQFILEDGVKFKLHCSEHSHHHHFICTSCESTYPYNFCPMGTEIIPPTGFKVIKHKFEIYGLCENCQKDGDVK